MVLAIECKPAKESMVADGALSSFLSVLDIFHVLSTVPEWSSTVAQVVFYFHEFSPQPFLQAVQSTKLYPAYRAIMMGLDIEVDKAKLATEFVTLATSLKSEGKWKKVREKFMLMHC